MKDNNNKDINPNLQQGAVGSSVNQDLSEDLKGKIEWKYNNNVYVNLCPSCPVKDSVVKEGLYFSKG